MTDEADRIVAAHGGVTEVVRAALDDYLCDADRAAAILAAHDAEVAVRTLREMAEEFRQIEKLGLDGLATPEESCLYRASEIERTDR